MEKAKIDTLSVEELLIYILELDEESEDIYDDIENGLQDILDDEGSNVDFVHELLRRIMPLVDIGHSPLSKENYRVLGKDGLSFIKVPYAN